MSGPSDIIFAERFANRLTLSQAEILLSIEAGAKTFARRAAKSVEGLVDRELVTADFDLSAPDPLRGRVYEIWRNCAVTTGGSLVCEVLRTRFAPLMALRASADARGEPA